MPRIHRKTELGRQALSTRQPPLPRAVRNLLVLIDGRRGDAELLEMLGHVDVDDASFAQLRELGLVEIAQQDEAPPDACDAMPGEPPGAPPGAPAAAPQERRAGMFERLGQGVRRALQAPQESPREVSAGLAEIIRCAALADAELFVWLETRVEALRERDPESVAHVVRRVPELRAGIEADDRRLRRAVPLLSYGTRLGGVVESLAGYGEYLHGEALALGMCLASTLGEDAGLQSRSSAVRLRDLLMRAGLPTRLPRAPSARWLQWLPVDRPGPQGMLDLILLEDIARPQPRRVAPSAVLDALDRIGALSA